MTKKSERKSCDYWALVQDLREKDKKPYLLKALDLFSLNGANEAKRFKPKHDKDFTKNEYGRLVTVEGKECLVRHTIYALSSSASDLKTRFKEEKRVKKVGTRLSIGPVCEPATNYSFPDLTRKARQDKREEKENIQKAKAKGGSDTLKRQERQKDEERERKRNEEEQLKRQERKKEEETEKERKRNEEDQLKIQEERKRNEEEQLKRQERKKEEEMEKERKRNEEEQLKIQEENRKRQEEEEDEEDEERRKTEGQMDLNSKLDCVLAEIAGVKAIVLKLGGAAEAGNGDDDDDDECVVERRKKSKLGELPTNLIDEEEVEFGKVKVGKQRYVSMEKLIVAERSPYFTNRVETLAQDFYDDVGNCSVSKSKGRTLIENAEIKSIFCILKAMKWSHSATLSLKRIRARLIRFTSEMRKNGNSRKRKLEMSAADGKRRKNSDESSSSSSEGRSETENGNVNGEGTENGNDIGILDSVDDEIEDGTGSKEKDLEVSDESGGECSIHLDDSTLSVFQNC
ncbi:reticulocyte-binding protein homolog 2a-like [Frankliniella occidentalis]|uniref:Reticulocyte-binding protein homolog 2a-like n=1 Tax=Frankliniella occidentalis TaxID=133901 RepID=A0A6J1T0N6_FRAOC|nr:reticulocyte-binding protein homolog 2a-like [Frankliniella occidentalis]